MVLIKSQYIFTCSAKVYNGFMTEEFPADLIRRTRAWNIAGTHLAGERAARLRAMADDDARMIIERIFSGPMPVRLERESGLVLQQQLFRRLK
jgi:hypothetical protein